MTLIKHKYTYPQLKRVQTQSGRRYSMDGTLQSAVPSVTTILSETGDKSHLIAWRNRVGEAEANRISTESAGLGTRVHTALEKYILGEEWDTFGSNLIQKMARAATLSMVESGLSKTSEVWGIEVGVIAEGVYAGTVDCVGLYNGVPSIIDFKTSKKIKKREWIEDYFLQAAAYSLAHDEMFGSDIQQLVILMVDREANFGEFVVAADEIRHYQEKWAQRVLDYYQKA